MPPIGRISAPMNGPVQAYINALGPFGFTVVWVITPSTAICWKPKTTLIARPKAAAYPIKEPKVIV